VQPPMTNLPQPSPKRPLLFRWTAVAVLLAGVPQGQAELAVAVLRGDLPRDVERDAAERFASRYGIGQRFFERRTCPSTARDARQRHSERLFASREIAHRAAGAALALWMALIIAPADSIGGYMLSKAYFAPSRAALGAKLRRAIPEEPLRHSVGDALSKRRRAAAHFHTLSRSSRASAGTWRLRCW